MNQGALSHLKVIDLTSSVAGPYCTKLMAGFGADVIKVESPGTGDRLRSTGPFFNNEEGMERSIPFLYLNTGKRSVAVDLQSERGAAAVRDLVLKADVLVESFAPGVMDRLGIGYESLREINPGLVMASISSFGQTGPYRGFEAEEIELQALSGLMHMTGDSDKPPLATGPALCAYSAAIHAYTAILMALFQRGTTGKGQYVDASVMESGIENIETRLTNYLHLDKASKRGPHTFAPWGLFSCLDGYVAVIGAPFRHWLKAAEMFDEPRILEDRFRTARGRSENRDELNELIRPWFEARTKKEIFETARRNRLAFGYLAGFDEVLESPQHEAREFFVDIDHPVVGAHKYCDAPFKMSRTPWKSVRAPLLGEHNEEVLGDLLGYATDEIRGLREEGVI